MAESFVTTYYIFVHITRSLFAPRDGSLQVAMQQAHTILWTSIKTLCAETTNSFWQASNQRAWNLQRIWIVNGPQQSGFESQIMNLRVETMCRNANPSRDWPVEGFRLPCNSVTNLKFCISYVLWLSFLRQVEQREMYYRTPRDQVNDIMYLHC